MPPTDRLKQYLAELCPLPELDWQLVLGLIQHRTFRRKEPILKTGQIEDYVSYVDRGIVRYYVEEGDREITFDLAFENSLAAGYESFLTRKPVAYHAEALIDTELWSIDYTGLQRLYASSKTGDRLGRLAAERLYIYKNQRQMSLLKDTAEQRYLRLLNENAHFVQLAPLKYLASYIGVTPQALSRIRRRLSGGSPD